MSRVLFEIVASDVGVSKQLDDIRARVIQLKKEIKGTKEGTTEYEKLTNQLVEAKIEVNNLTAAQRALNKEFKAAQVPTDSLAGLRLEYSALTEQITKLSAAQRNSDFGKNLTSRAATLKNEINGIEESLGRFTGSVGNYQKGLTTIGDLVTGGLLTGGIIVAAQKVTEVLGAGVTGIREYGQSLSELSSLTGLVGDDLEKFRVAAESLTTIEFPDGSKIVNTASDIFEAFKLVGGAQPELLKSADALKQVTKDALVLSAASGDDLPSSVKALTTTLGQFQLAASESNRVINELAAGARAGTSEIPDTTDALQKFGTTAKNANISTGESVALIQTLADQQLKGAEAGTQLRNVLVKLSSADVLPPKAIDEFERAGISIETLRDTTLPLEVRLRELGKLQGDTSALARIFGVENLTAAQILTNSVDKYANFKTAIEGTNEAYTQANTNVSNLNTELINLGKQGLNGLIEVFRRLEPVLLFFVSVLSQAFSILGSIFSLLGQLPKFIDDNKVAFAGLATGIAILNGSLILASANTLRLAAVQRIQTVATTLMTGAQTLLNAALRANPIGIVITALSALAIGLNTAYNKSETFRASIDGLGAVVSELFKIFKESFGSFVEGFERFGSGDLSGALDSFGTAFKKSNPLGIAFTQGDRLGKAYADGYKNSAKNIAETAAATTDVVIKANETIIDTTETTTKQQEEAAKKAAERTEAQLERIREAERSLRELAAAGIENEFDRKIAEIETKRLAALEVVDKRRLELADKIKQQGGRLFDSDELESSLIAKETAAINEAYKKQISDVNTNRKEAFDNARTELEKLLLEVERLGIENGERLAELDAQITGAGFSDQINAFKQNLEDRKEALTQSLIDREITESEFAELTQQAETETTEKILQLERERYAAVVESTNALVRIKTTAAQTVLDSELFAIEQSLAADLAALAERERVEGIDATDLKIQREKQANEQRIKSQTDYTTAVTDASKAAADAQIASLNEVEQTEQQLQQQRLQRLQEEQEFRKVLLDSVFEATKAITGAIFDIAADNINSEKDARLTALDDEYSKRLEAAQGNAVEEEKIKKELELKKLAIEKDAANKRKRASIIEAGINTAVAITKALTGAIPPINFILAGLAAVAGAAQIAVIASQQFAAGGFTGRGRDRDSTGRRVAGVVHENEYVAPTSQIQRYPEVFAWLENDRRKKLRPFAAGGFTSDYIPQFGVPGGSSPNTLSIAANAEFTDEQVAQIGRILSSEISTAVAIEMRSGLADGLGDANRRLERQNNLDEQRQV